MPSDKPLPCVVLVRPMTPDDPCLTRTREGFALRSTLSGLREARLAGDMVISMPATVPDGRRDCLASWGIPIHASQHEQPQQRLMQCMEQHGWQQVLVLTSYSVLLDAEAIVRAADVVRQGEADAVYPSDVIAPKFFIALNQNAVRTLAKKHHNPLPPFVFPEKLRSREQLRVRKVEGLESPWERFLWELLFAGKRNAVPVEALDAFQARFKGRERFRQANFEAFIASHHGISDPDKLNEPLLKMAEYDSSLQLAKQLNHARSLAEHFPEHRGTALEIGHGRTPLTALSLATVFDRVIGADVYRHREDGIHDSARFFITLSEQGLAVPPPNGKAHAVASVLERTLFHHGEAQQVPLPEDSVDFCYSHMVLEHVTDMPALARYLAGVMRPGGVMVHEIDHQDHQDLSHINFEFLNHSQEEWAAMGNEGNLLRINDFIDLFQKSGFDVQVLDREVRIVRPTSLHPSWRRYKDEDLYCYRTILKAIRT